MKLTDMQKSVLETIYKETTSHDRFISIEHLEQSLAHNNIVLWRQEIFTVLSALRIDGKIDFTWPQEDFVYTLQQPSTMS